MPLSTGAATHSVRFDDATPEPQLGETELRVEESPTTRLVASHRGPTGDEKETRFLFRGPKFSALEDRSITIRLRRQRAGSDDTADGRRARGAARGSSPRRWSPSVVVLLSSLLLVRKKRRA